MAKAKSIFFCQNCGYESSKWLGQCPGCREWNSFVEEKPLKSGSGSNRKDRQDLKPVRLAEVSAEQEERLSSGIKELDRVLGGGIVRGSLVLVGGDPGIGKSTLLLQTCRHLAKRGVKTLYVSGEESLQQIRMRANRIGEFSDDLFLLCETDLDAVQEAVLRMKPEVVIVDSIQTMYREEVSSGAGSVSQVREATNLLMQLAKREGIAIFLVGHVTKEGVVAGPRVLEHMVDTVLYFEGDRHASYRVLRAVKNRFGSTNEIGVFEMRSEGLAEVEDPSEFMLGGRPEGTAGSVVSCAIEGTRPLMIEVQALVCQTGFQMPRRTAAGIDYNRVNLLIAVLEKRLGLRLGSCDAYINLAGGMRLNEPAMDLAVTAAIISSFTNVPVPSDTLIFGEVGLTGEVRSVSQPENRVREGAKLGFSVCCMPAANVRHLKKQEEITVVPIASVQDLYQFLQKGARRQDNK